jgi:two-component system LytT family response regulator
MLRTVIIDDETHIRDTLARLISRHCPQISLAGEATGVEEGVALIRSIHPDLIFLDMNMSDGTGFDLLRSLGMVDFRVIFISAFDKSTIQSFKLSGVEYLVKPFNPVKLQEAVARIEATVK